MRPDKRPEGGMSLIEVLVAISILAVVLMALGVLMYQVARHSRSSAVATYRTGAAQLAAVSIQGLPFDNLSVAVGCVSDSLGMLEYTRCITVDNVSASRKDVQIVIHPTGNLVASPDTQVIARSKFRLRSPLTPP